jgi:hypothetical protein
LQRKSEGWRQIAGKQELAGGLSILLGYRPDWRLALRTVSGCGHADAAQVLGDQPMHQMQIHHVHEERLNAGAERC